MKIDMRAINRKLAAGAAGVALLAAGSGAYAATRHGSDNERRAFLKDAAGRLQVTPKQLENALRGAALDRLEAAVKAGRLTQQQADAIKQRLQSGRGLGLGALHGFRHHGLWLHHRGFALLDAAARYLHMTDLQLRNQLAARKSLADVAQARGKSVSALEDALKAAVRARLDAAVKARRLTRAQERRILARVDLRIADLVEHRGLHHP